jgi:hypothetical protein
MNPTDGLAGLILAVPATDRNHFRKELPSYQPGERGRAMAAIVAIVFAVAAGFAFVVLIFVIVIIGVRREERYLTFSNRTAPGAVALLARIVLGRYVRKERRPQQRGCYPDDLASSREPSVGPRR